MRVAFYSPRKEAGSAPPPFVWHASFRSCRCFLNAAIVLGRKMSLLYCSSDIQTALPEIRVNAGRTTIVGGVLQPRFEKAWIGVAGL